LTAQIEPAQDKHILFTEKRASTIELYRYIIS